jgi:hypothetical protein
MSGDKMSITRRDFVGWAAAGVAGGVLAAAPKVLLAEVVCETANQGNCF